MATEYSQPYNPRFEYHVKLHYISNETRRHYKLQHDSAFGEVTATMVSKKNVDLPLSAGRVSSRFSEYVFQFLRCSNKTSSKFSVLSGKHLLKLCMSTLRIEREAGWVFPPFKRGERERGKAHDTPVQYLYVESATIGGSEIKSMLDLGMEQVTTLI